MGDIAVDLARMRGDVVQVQLAAAGVDRVRPCGVIRAAVDGGGAMFIHTVGMIGRRQQIDIETVVAARMKVDDILDGPAILEVCDVTHQRHKVDVCHGIFPANVLSRYWQTASEHVG